MNELRRKQWQFVSDDCVSALPRPSCRQWAVCEPRAIGISSFRNPAQFKQMKNFVCLHIEKRYAKFESPITQTKINFRFELSGDHYISTTTSPTYRTGLCVSSMRCCCGLQKGTKNALETGRTFATLFADIDLRQQLLCVNSHDEFKKLLWEHTKELAEAQSHPERKLSGPGGVGGAAGPDSQAAADDVRISSLPGCSTVTLGSVCWV